MKLFLKKLYKTFPGLYIFIYKNIARYFIIFFRTLHNLYLWNTDYFKIYKNKTETKGKILGIYDLSYQPYSIGDFIDLNQSCLLKAYEYKIEIIDIAIINSYKTKNKSIEYNMINQENSLFFINSIISVIQLNSKIGSLFIFDDHDQYLKFILDNKNKYIVLPNSRQLALKTYIMRVAFNDVYFNFYNKYKKINNIEIPQYLKDWSMNFYKKFDNNKTTFITVNLRNNPIHAFDRNSNLNVWIDFFDYYKSIYNIKFIIICAKSEVDERFRYLDNVIIAKDYNTTLEQDLSLISTSTIHLGTASGPFSVALYTTKPYMMFSWNGDATTHKCIKKVDNYFQFIFANKHQKIFNEKETTEVLKNEFEIFLKENLLVSTIENKLQHSDVVTTWLN
jgi:hypothetical protein